MSLGSSNGAWWGFCGLKEHTLDLHKKRLDVTWFLFFAVEVLVDFFVLQVIWYNKSFVVFCTLWLFEMFLFVKEWLILENNSLRCIFFSVAFCKWFNANDKGIVRVWTTNEAQEIEKIITLWNIIMKMTFVIFYIYAFNRHLLWISEGRWML